MAADNGIYIGVFPTTEGKEFRVIHAQAIENCDDIAFDGTSRTQEEVDAYRVMYFGSAKPFKTIEEARTEAWRLHDEIMSSDFPVLEYGISEIEFTRPLQSIPPEKAREFINKLFSLS